MLNTDDNSGWVSQRLKLIETCVFAVQGLLVAKPHIHQGLKHRSLALQHLAVLLERTSQVHCLFIASYHKAMQYTFACDLCM